MGCGKILFPWTKKYYLNDKVCCEKCFKRELELFDFPEELYNVPENMWDLPKIKEE